MITAQRARELAKELFDKAEYIMSWNRPHPDVQALHQKDADKYRETAEALTLLAEILEQEPVAFVEYTSHHGHQCRNARLYDAGTKLPDGTQLIIKPEQKK